MNIMCILIKHGCKIFVDLIYNTGVLKSYEEAIQGGLSKFSLTDAAFAGVTNKMLNKLSNEDKVYLLEFHALTIYIPLGPLKTTNGPISMMTSTGTGRYVLTVTSSSDILIICSNKGA